MSDKERLEENIEEIEKSLESEEDKGLIRRFVDWHRQSNGFLNKTGKHWCKAEGHAVAIPLGFVSSSYMLPQPLDIFVFASFFLMWRKGFGLAKDPSYQGHWNDVIDESAYSAMAMMGTIMYWKYFTVETIEVSVVSSVLLKAFGL